METTVTASATDQPSHHLVKPNQQIGSLKACFFCLFVCFSHLIDFTLPAGVSNCFNFNHKPRFKEFWEMEVVSLLLCDAGNHQEESKDILSEFI